MPVTPTYPGVYIEEVPSGVRTITGVATSITAFIGRAARGPVNEPFTINNFGDFERTFGGLGIDYPMSYAVRDFFLNGGAQALIVRLYKDKAPEEGDGEGTDGIAEIKAGGPGEGDEDPVTLKLTAANEGKWGNDLSVRIDHKVPPQPEDSNDPHPLPWVKVFGLTSNDLFNLTVRNRASQVTESYLNLTVKESPRRVDRVLEVESNLIRVPDESQLGNDKPRPSRHLKFQIDPIGGNGGNGEGNGEPVKIKKADEVWTEGDLSSQASHGSDGQGLGPDDYKGSQDKKEGLFALEKADLFNLLCIPPDTRGQDTPNTVYQQAMAYCQKRRAMLIVDAPAGWGSNKETAASKARDGLSDLGLTGVAARNAALYFPRVRQADPLRDGQIDTFVPCGIVAGVMARTDTQRGVWKAPAGIDAALRGTQGLQVNLTDDENGMLNPLGINCLRSFPITGRVAWGARTLRGADQLGDEYKYVPVRRLALFIEESLYRGTQWVVFEPNDEPLWAQIRLNVGAFMQNLFRQGAFQGKTPREAYLVKVDSETTTQNDINLGIVNIVVGFAPLKPAEFVIIKIQQLAGQIET